VRKFFDEKIVDVDSFIAKAVESWNDKSFSNQENTGLFFLVA
jgi:hypothetical protein